MPGRYLDPFTPPNHFPRLNFTPKVVFLLKNIKHHPVQNSPIDEEGDRGENKTGTNISLYTVCQKTQQLTWTNKNKILSQSNIWYHFQWIFYSENKFILDL